MKSTDYLKKAVGIYDSIGLPNIITSVMIEPTNRCQLKCVTCYREGRPVGDMKWETFERTLKQIQNIVTVRAINLNFAGEPLLYEHLNIMVKRVNELKNKLGMPYKLGFSTNGLLLDEDAARYYLGRLDWLNVSLDGVGIEHERHRTNSIWEITVCNLNRLLALPRGKTKISVNMTVSDQTDDEILKFLSQCEWEGVADSVLINPSHNENLEIINWAGRKPNSNYCWAFKHDLAVLWNGDVTTCCGDLQGKNVFGNIWDLELKKMKKRVGPLCEKCEVWQLK